MTSSFVVFLAISEIFHTAEFGFLNVDYEGDYTRLRKSYIMKLVIVIAQAVIAIMFVVLKTNFR